MTRIAGRFSKLERQGACSKLLESDKIDKQPKDIYTNHGFERVAETHHMGDDVTVQECSIKLDMA